jgi:enediyne biosynthesis protein E4
MSKRHRLIWRTLAYCAVPVVLASAALFAWRRTKDAPYVPGAEREGITRALDRESLGARSGIRFTEVTDEAGLRFDHFPFERTSQLPEDMASGLAWGDYDGDGWIDLFLVNFAAPVGTSDEVMAASTAVDRLFRNLGDGSFEDVTESAGVGAAHRGMGAAWADYDSDGDLDLFVTSWGDNILWQNQGDGTFRNVTEASGLRGAGFWTGASWSDFDLDGDLDLYVSGYVEYTPEDPGSIRSRSDGTDFPFTLNPSSYPPAENRLFVNLGDGTFEDRARAAGVLGERGRSLAAAWTDLDEDGWPDLYVANDVSDNLLYLNRGDGTFEDASYRALVSDYRGAMGIGVGDWDEDLDLDLFITHWIAQENALYTNQRAEMLEGGEDRGLFFGDDADRVGLGQISLDLIGWATSFVDVDADGRLDLFVANGSTFQERSDPTALVPMDPHLYWNRGAEEGFFEVGEAAGIRTVPPGVGRGAAFADFDRDGDLDLAILRHGARARLLRNDSDRGRSVTLRLRARSGHPSALGARLLVYVGDRRLLRIVGGGAPYLSQNAPDVIVGLGDASRADSVAVSWPGGATEVFRSLDAERVWDLVEGEDPSAVSFGAKRAPDRPMREEARPVRSARGSRAEARRFWVLRDSANALFTQGRWAPAAELFQEMLDLDPLHEDARYSLGNALLELGRYDEAMEAWRRLLEVNPASARAWIQTGILRAMPSAGALYDLAAARSAFERAHELNREQSRSLVLLGEVAIAQGDLDSAADVLVDAYRMNDQSVAAAYFAGYVAWKRGSPEEARRLIGLAFDASRPEVGADAPPGEGDTRDDALTEGREAAARRRLFSECVERLREASASPTPAESYPCVDRARAALPPEPGGSLGHASVVVQDDPRLIGWPLAERVLVGLDQEGFRG